MCRHSGISGPPPISLPISRHSRQRDLLKVHRVPRLHLISLLSAASLDCLLSPETLTYRAFYRAGPPFNVRPPPFPRCRSKKEPHALAWLSSSVRLFGTVPNSYASPWPCLAFFAHLQHTATRCNCTCNCTVLYCTVLHCIAAAHNAVLQVCGFSVGHSPNHTFREPFSCVRACVRSSEQATALFDQSDQSLLQDDDDNYNNNNNEKPKENKIKKSSTRAAGFQLALRCRAAFSCDPKTRQNPNPKSQLPVCQAVFQGRAELRATGKRHWASTTIHRARSYTRRIYTHPPPPFVLSVTSLFCDRLPTTLYAFASRTIIRPRLSY